MKSQIIKWSAGLAFLVLTSAASAQSSMSGPSAPAAGETGSFCGPVVNLAEGGCIGVHSTMVGGAMYEISSASPKPPVGTTVMGSGTTGGVSFCMQGTHLNDVKWHKVAVCPLTKKSTM